MKLVPGLRNSPQLKSDSEHGTKKASGMLHIPLFSLELMNAFE